MLQPLSRRVGINNHNISIFYKLSKNLGFTTIKTKRRKLLCFLEIIIREASSIIHVVYFYPYYLTIIAWSMVSDPSVRYRKCKNEYFIHWCALLNPTNIYLNILRMKIIITYFFMTLKSYRAVSVYWVCCTLATLKNVW